jgi:hypothetical protein
MSSRGPVADPGRWYVVDATGREQLPPGRQVQHRLDVLEVLVPADGGQVAARGLEAAVGLQVELSAAHFDSGPAVGTGRDELQLTVEQRLAEHGGLVHDHAPATVDGAADAVANRIAAAVEVEPQVALQRQRIGCRLWVATAQLVEQQARAGLHQVGGQVAPRLRQRGLGGIHRWWAVELDQAQFRVSLEGPHLLGGPRRRSAREFELCHRGPGSVP